MRVIKLLGALGKKFGREHRFDVQTPAEAIRALRANFKGFEQHLLQSAEHGVAYKVLVNNKPIADAQGLFDLHGQKAAFTIAPVIAGAKSGLGVVFAGAALIAISVATGGFGVSLATAYAAGGVGLAASALAGSIGLALALGGVAQMLSPTPKTADPKETDATKPSYLFSGPVNMTAQGQPVPIGYGELIVGSAEISSSIITEDL